MMVTDIGKRKNVMIIIMAMCVTLVFTFMMTEKTIAAGRSPANAEWINLNNDIYEEAPKTKDNNYNKQYNYFKFRTDNIDGVQYIAKSVATGSHGIYAIIVDQNYNEVEAAGRDRNDFGADVGMGYSSRFNLQKNSVYYIRVNGWNYYGKTPYMIRIQKVINKPGKPVVDYLKAGKRKLTLKYYKATYATKYQVRIKKGHGNWSKAYNNKAKLNWIKKGLKSKKKYCVQVRAIRTVNGNDYVGAWSRTASVKVK